MVEGRVVIIPFLKGKVNFDGTVTEPDIEAILDRWLERHPEFQGPDRDYRIIRARNFMLDDDDEENIETGLVRVTAAASPDLERYDPAEDADLYEEFLAESEPSAPREFHKIWIDQCEAAEQIEADYGTEKALGYLIGEKFLNFLEAAEMTLRVACGNPAICRQDQGDFRILADRSVLRNTSATGHTGTRSRRRRTQTLPQSS